HALMRNRAIVQTPAEFQAWAQANAKPAPAPTGDAQRGAQLFTGTGACSGCHTVNGLQGAVGQVGPNLTHFATRTTIAGGTLDNNEENLRRWLTDPQAVKPDNDMKIRTLNKDEIDALVAF